MYFFDYVSLNLSPRMLMETVACSLQDAAEPVSKLGGVLGSSPGGPEANRAPALGVLESGGGRQSAREV